MNRRRFLSTSCSALSICAAKSSLASQACMQPFMTPMGAVQQCTAGIDSLSFTTAVAASDRQLQSEWCWAACISMIFAYHGHPVSQVRIVQETWGGIVNMAAQPQQILNDLNSNWTDDNGDDFTASASAVSTDVVTAVQDLQQDQPLIIGALGHAMVLTALTANTNLSNGMWSIVGATVRDPWPYHPSTRILSPMEWNNIAFAARVRVSD